MNAAAKRQEQPGSPDVFISYSRKDQEFVRCLDQALKERECEAWVDWEAIRPSEEFMQAIYHAIESADTFVFVLSPDSLASKVCAREIAHAAAHNKRMVPIVARDVETSAVPESLAKLNWIFCRASDDFGAASDSLVSALETDLEWVHAHTRLLTRALEWEANKRSSSFTLRGEDLRSAEQWLAQAGSDKERQPTALQTEYIIASRKATAQRQRIVLGSLVFGLLIAIALGLLAWSQRNQARRQTQIASAGRLAGFGLSFLKDQLPLALLLGVEAYQTADTVEARNTLLIALQTEPGLVAFLHGHRGSIESMAFSPGGRIFASGGEDGSVRIWDLNTRREIGGPLHQFPSRSRDSKNSVRCLGFSPDGAILAAGTIDGDLAVWEVTSRRSLGERRFGETVNSVAFSPDSKFLTVGGDLRLSLQDNGTLSLGREPVWQRDRAWIDQLGPIEPHFAILSPDGTKLLAFVDEELSLWDATTHSLVGKLPGRIEEITALRYNPNGKFIVAADRIGAVRVWNAERREVLGEAITSTSKSVHDIAFSADSKTLLWSGSDGNVYRYDTEKAALIGNQIAIGSFASFDISPDGKTIAVGALDGTIRIHEVDPSPSLGVQISTDRTWNLSFSSDGRLLAAVGSERAPEIFDAHTGASIGTLNDWSGARSITFVGASHQLVIGSESGAMRFWDADTQQPLSEPILGDKADSDVWSIASSPDGKTIVTAGSDGTLRFWNTENRAPTGEPIAAHGKDAYCVVFNSAGTMLASGGDDNMVRLWDARTRQSLGALAPAHSDSVWSVAFSPDGKVLASGDNTGALVLWDVVKQSRLGEPVPGNHSRVAALSFSPDGKTLVSAAFGGTLRFIDAESHQPLASPVLAEGEYATVNAVAFSPDGNTVAAGLNNPPGLFLLDASPAAWKTRAARRANRNLSLAEWKRFFGNQPYRRTFAELPPGAGVSQE